MARTNSNNIITPSLRVYSSALKNWLRKTSGYSRAHVGLLRSARSPLVLRSNSSNHLSIHMPLSSLRGGRKLDEAIHITSFMDCHAHIRSLAMTLEGRLLRPLRGFAMMPEGRLLCLGFTPSCDYVNLLWINTNWVSYNLDIIV